MGKIVCLRRALLYKRRKEVQLDELQSVDVGYSIWEGMSKVVASVDSAEIGLLTLPEDEAEEVIEHINEFLGEEESEYSTPTEAVAEESLCSRLIKFARDAYLIIVGSVVIISSFFAEVLPSLGAMSPLAAVGTVMFFVGALYFLVASVLFLSLGRRSTYIRFSVKDPTTHLGASIVLVMVAFALIVVGS